MILFSTLSVIRHLMCGNNYNWFQNLNLRDTLDKGRKWLVYFNADKTRLVSFCQSNNTGAIDVKIDEFVLEERSSLKMLGLSFLLNWIGILTLSLLLKLPLAKLEL